MMHYKIEWVPAAETLHSQHLAVSRAQERLNSIMDENLILYSSICASFIPNSNSANHFFTSYKDAGV